MVSSAFLRASLRACCAALRARAAWVALVMISRPSVGLRSNQSASHSLHTFWTNDLASELPSLVLVWPSNCGSASLIEMIAARPSRMSSPVSLSSLGLKIFFSVAHLLTTEVSADRKPSSWVPPSMRVDGVGEGVDRLGVRLVPLHRDLGRHLQVRVLGLEVDHRLVDRRLGGVEVLDEVGDAAGVVVGDLAVLVLAAALVAGLDGQPLVQEGHLLQPAGDGLEGELDRLEDRRRPARTSRRCRSAWLGSPLASGAAGFWSTYGWRQT